MPEEVVQPEISYADALKSSLNADSTPPVQAVAEPIITPATTVIEEVKPTFDPQAYLKETFGEEFADPQIIKAKLTAPAPEPVFKEPTFTTEESRLIYENLQAGNHKVVKDFLDKKDLVASLPDRTPADIIKLGWKEEFGLTDAEAERRFNKTYSIPDVELMEDEDKAIEQKLLDKQIEKEAGKYKDFFSKYNTEITLPSLDKPAPASAQPVVTEETRQAERYAAELNKSLPADASKIGYQYTDEQSDYKLSGQIELTDEEINKFSAPLSGNEDQYFAARWFPQGEPNDKQIKSDLYWLHNKETIINTLVVDVVHQTRIEEQKRNRNYQAPGAVVQGDFQPSETQQKQEYYKKYFM